MLRHFTKSRHTDELLNFLNVFSFRLYRCCSTVDFGPLNISDKLNFIPTEKCYKFSWPQEALRLKSRTKNPESLLRGPSPQRYPADTHVCWRGESYRMWACGEVT
jgi:hypothetical protein